MRIIVIGSVGVDDNNIVEKLMRLNVEVKSPDDKLFCQGIKSQLEKYFKEQNAVFEKQLVARHPLFEFLWPKKEEKKVIFVSEDGVKFFEGDEKNTVFYVNKNFPSGAHRSILKEKLSLNQWPSCLVFANEDAANAYIREHKIRNKPVFTFEEMYSLYAGVGDFKNRVKKSGDIYKIAEERCKL